MNLNDLQRLMGEIKARSERIAIDCLPTEDDGNNDIRKAYFVTGMVVALDQLLLLAIPLAVTKEMVKP